MKKFLKRHSQVKNYAFILLIAIEFLMSFTFLGYIHIPPISITIAYIPILIAGCFLGVGQSTFLGFLFGVASMYKATAYYVMASDQIFSPFMSSSPAASLLLSVGTRTIFGLLVGLAFFTCQTIILQQTSGNRNRFHTVTYSTRCHSLCGYGIVFPTAKSGKLIKFHTGSEQYTCNPVMFFTVTVFVESL